MHGQFYFIEIDISCLQFLSICCQRRQNDNLRPFTSWGQPTPASWKISQICINYDEMFW